MDLSSQVTVCKRGGHANGKKTSREILHQISRETHFNYEDDNIYINRVFAVNNRLLLQSIDVAQLLKCQKPHELRQFETPDHS